MSYTYGVVPSYCHRGDDGYDGFVLGHLEEKPRCLPTPGLEGEEKRERGREGERRGERCGVKEQETKEISEKRR